MVREFLSLNEHLRSLFGTRVQKIPLDAGFTCPNRDGTKGRTGCIYCDPRGSGTGLYKKGYSVAQQMISGIKWAERRYKARLFIAYFQSFSNTYAPPERLEATYREAIINSDVVGLFIGTRPDCIDSDVIRAIKRAAQDRYVTVELGLQSANNDTLKAINRGHTVEDFIRAVELLKRYKIPVCSHVIFGLPGEGHDEMLESVRLLADLGVEGIKFHQLYILEGTKAELLYRQGAIRELSLQEYASLVAEAIKLLPPQTVVHRLQGDPPRSERLIAPQWSYKKGEVRRLILETLGLDK